MTTRLSFLSPILTSFLLGLPLGALAQATGADLALRQPSPSAPKAVVTGEVQMQGAQYQTSLPGPSSLDRSLLLSGRVKGRRASGPLETGLDIKGERDLGWDSGHFMVPELYASYQWRDQKSELAVGRKKHSWSLMDQAWHLGMWQPEDTYDGLRPETQGLFGAFFRHQQGDFEFLGFASTVFIPSMGPEIHEKEGQLVSNNRWYRPPTQTFLLFDREHRAFYSVSLPDSSEFLRQKSIGARLCVGCEREGFFASAHLGRKPMNTLLVKYSRWLDLTEEKGEDNTGAAPVAPVISYHSLGGADVGYRFSKAVVSFSYLEDHPEEIAIAPEDVWIYQRAQPMKAYSVQTQARLDDFGLPDLVLAAGYLRLHGSDLSSFDSEGVSHESPFTQRFTFTNAASLEGAYSYFWKGYQWTSRLRYIRDFDQKGMAANAEVIFYPAKSLALSVGTDVLGVDDAGPENKDERFLNTFRANDRVYGGVSYVF